MAKLDFTRPILAGAAVLFCVLWLTKSCDKPVTPPDDGTTWRTEVSKRDAIIATKDTVISQLQAELASVKKKAQKDSSVLHNQATVNFKRYSEARKDIQELRDSIPVVMAFVDAADSLVAVKELQYQQEVRTRLALDSLYQIEVKVLADKNVVQKQVSDLLTTKVTDLEDQNSKLARKLQRKKGWNNFWKGLTGGTAAAAAVIILSNQ